MIVHPMENKQAAKRLKRFAWLGRAKTAPPWDEMVPAPVVGCFFLVRGHLAGSHIACPGQQLGRK
jgi:hypothetical protein